MESREASLFRLFGKERKRAVLCLCWLFWYSRSKASAPPPSSSVAALGPVSLADTSSADDFAPTLVYAHNLLLRKGPNFRIYIRWIRGQMIRARRQVNPSFDDPESFVLQIQKGVIHANIGDISNYLNASSPPNAPLKNISIQPEGDQLKLHGTIHKVFSLPIGLVGSLTPTPDRAKGPNRSVTRLSSWIWLFGGRRV